MVGGGIKMVEVFSFVVHYMYILFRSSAHHRVRAPSLLFPPSLASSPHIVCVVPFFLPSVPLFIPSISSLLITQRFLCWYSVSRLS